MTAKQIVRQAKTIRVVFGLFNSAGEATIYITKKEALRLIDEHELTTTSTWDGGSDSGSVGKNADGTIATISLVT